jgi:flagellar motor switch protein FliN
MMNDMTLDAQMLQDAQLLKDTQLLKDSGPLQSSGAFDPATSPNFRMLADVPVRLSVEVGSASLRLRDILALGEGSVVELDRQADDLLDIKVNGTLIAKGEVVSTNGRFGVRLVEVMAQGALLGGIERRS